MSINSNLAFGPKLRAHRERRGITLEALAESTKIRRSLLADLERNDVSRWPIGIYRRAFVREYAKAIGLPANVILEEFCGLFPEPEEPQSAAPRAELVLGSNSSELRLALADAPTPTPRLIYARLFDAVGALALVLATGCVVSLIADLAYWTASGIVALIWYPATTVYGDGALRRMLRPRRFSNWPLSRTTNVSVDAGSLVSIGKIVNGVDSTAESPIIDPDIYAASSASPTIH